MIMTNPQALLLLLLLPVFWWLSWRAWTAMAVGGRVLSVVLRTSIVSLVVVALAAPTIPLRQDGTSVVFAVDELASMSEEVKRDAQQWVQEAMKTMGGQDRAAVVTFGRDPQVQRGLSRGAWPHLHHQPGRRQFDQHRARPARQPVAALERRQPPDRPRHRWQRRTLATPVRRRAWPRPRASRSARSIIPPKTVQPEVLVQALEAPSNVRDGEDFDLTVTVYSTVKQPAVIRLWLDNKGVGSAAGRFGAGRDALHGPPTAAAAGLPRLPPDGRGASGHPAGQQRRLHHQRSCANAREVLLIEGKDGDGKPIADALSSSGIDVDTRQPKAIPNTLSGLRDYQSIVLFDVPATAHDARPNEDAGAVRPDPRARPASDRRLAVVRAWATTLTRRLEAALPVSMDIPPRDDKPSVALLLIIDKSGSMDYGGRDGPNKMAMAREAAVLATEELDATDQIGVLAFDDSNRWIVPFQTIGTGATREGVKQKIQSIQAGGGTEIFPALQTGYVDLRKRTAQLRHIILLTDGKSFTGGDYDSLVDRMRQDQITLSTVGIGSDTDEALLKSLAVKGKGRYNLTVDAKKIPQIVTKETKIASKNPIVESRFHVQLGEISPILRGFKPEDLPALKGYVVTTPKPTAQRVLLLSIRRPDPVAVAVWPRPRRRLDAGYPRSLGFRLDHLGRLPKFISQAVRWTMPDPANRNLQTSVAFDGEETIVSLDAADDDGSFIDLATTTMIVAAADGTAQQRQIALRQIAPGRYEGGCQPGRRAPTACRSRSSASATARRSRISPASACRTRQNCDHRPAARRCCTSWRARRAASSWPARRRRSWRPTPARRRCRTRSGPGSCSSPGCCCRSRSPHAAASSARSSVAVPGDGSTSAAPAIDAGARRSLARSSTGPIDLIGPGGRGVGSIMRARTLPDLRAHEDVVWYARQHWIAPFRRAALPALAALVCLALALGAPLFAAGWPAPWPLAGTSLLTMAGALAVARLVWVYLDWVDDALIVTTDRVVWVEKTAFFHERRREIPLNRVQNMAVAVNGLAARWLGFGDVVIEAAGAPPLAVAAMSRPEALQQRIFDVQAWRQEQHARQERDCC